MSAAGGDPLGALPGGLGRDALAAEVRRALAWLPAGAGAGIAVSGGADSVTLAHLLGAARPDLDTAVLHVRHGLRDDAADAAAAATTATGLGLRYVEARVRVRPDRRTGVAAAAREARLDALEREAVRLGLGTVLLAHTAEDQAETVLLNLGRGSGVAGMAGMPARRRHGAVTLARPLLRVRRADVRRLAAVSGWHWVEDPTNADRRRRRTVARETLLPALDAISGGEGDAVGLLARLADLARDDAAALDALASGEGARHVASWGPVRAVTLERLRGLPVALARRVVRRMLAEVRGGTAGLGARAVEASLGLRPGQSLDVSGGVRVTCGCGWLAAAPAEAAPLSWRALPAAGAVPLPELGLHLRVDALAGAPPGAAGAPPATLPEAAVPPLGTAAAHAWGRVPEAEGAGVRGWRAGDRIATGTGHAAVADLLARAGVPRPVRPLLPIVVDAGDRPLWVPGVAAAPRAGDGGARRVWLAAGLR